MIYLNNVFYFSAKVRRINFTGNEEGIVFTLEVNVIIANSLRALHDYPFKAPRVKISGRSTRTNANVRSNGIIRRNVHVNQTRLRRVPAPVA